MGQRVVSSFRTMHNNYCNDFMSQQPLSTPLQGGLRLFHPLMPAHPWAALRLAFPSRETYGVTMFHCHNKWVG
jgi:hypothetical protein